MYEEKINKSFLKRYSYKTERNWNDKCERIGETPKKNEIICYATAMVLSILFIIFTQRQKSSAYNSNLALKRFWKGNGTLVS